MARLFSLVTLMVVWVSARADEPDRAPSAMAQRTWQLTDVVLEQHVNPPARQAMLLAGIRARLSRSGSTVSADLSRRVSDVATLEQWDTLLSEVLAKQDDQTAPARELEGSLIAGILSAAPGQTHLVAAAQRKAIEGFAANRYVGTGVQIRYNDKEKLAQLISPIRNGPAHRAGAKPGDLIVEIDSKDVRDIGLSAVVELLRGDEGSDVLVVVRQPDSDEKRDLKITRGVSPVESLFGFQRVDDTRWQFRPDPEVAVAYLALNSLSSSTLHELKTMESKLKEDGVRGLILDLRFAQGGSVHHAALLADAFLDGGLMWKLKDAKQNARDFKADRDCLFRDWPLYILVDQMMGPPAVWIACALQDNGRAVVVGQMVARDGYTKSFVDLPGGKSAMELPTGILDRGMPRRSRPAESHDDNDLNPGSGWIIHPDHLVALSPKQRSEIDQWLQHKSWTEPPAGGKERPSADPQLEKAIELAREKLSAAGPAKNNGQSNPEA